jgi:hypothetical protein
MDNEPLNEDIQKYIRSMQEIKHRIKVALAILDGKTTTGQPPIDIETVALQTRKILELIALASVCVNKKEYSKMREKFYTDWHANRILNDIEKVNPKFYPMPGKQILEDGKAIGVRPVDEPYLTRGEFEELYDRCSDYMHANNPYGNSTDIEKAKLIFSESIQKIIMLLSNHRIQLKNSEQQLWVVMNDRESKDVRAVEMFRSKTKTGIISISEPRITI